MRKACEGMMCCYGVCGMTCYGGLSPELSVCHLQGRDSILLKSNELYLAILQLPFFFCLLHLNGLDHFLYTTVMPFLLCTIFAFTICTDQLAVK